VAPLRLGGRRGKQSTPRVWLGGTGEHSAVGKQERQGARDFNPGVDILQGRLKAKVCYLSVRIEGTKKNVDSTVIERVNGIEFYYIVALSFSWMTRID
jgi:hypothetical protein